MKKFILFTLGCKVNQYETQAIRENFLSQGFEEASEGRADVCVVNTCTVTARADAKSRHIIREAVRSNPEAVVVVTGCYAQGDAQDISRIPGVDLIVENKHKKDIGKIVVRYTGLRSLLRASLSNPAPRNDAGAGEDRGGFSLSISGFQGHTKAFVKVQDGCDNFCSYCKVPFVRGPSRSRPLNEIKSEVGRLVKEGFKELVLCGICLGAYGRDLKKDGEIIEVLDELEKIGQLKRIRLSSIEPNYITQKLIHRVCESKKICPHLHIPLQSGSDKILQSMNRAYAAAEYISMVGKARELMPEISITTDVMAGFPGESEQDFKKTLKVLRQVKPSRVHVFSFSKRKGTKAFCLNGQVPNEIISERVNRVRALAQTCSLEYRRRFLGRPVNCLVENTRMKAPTGVKCPKGVRPARPAGGHFVGTGLLAGYTDTYIKVVFEGPDELMNEIVPLRITEVAPTYTLGNIKV